MKEGILIEPIINNQAHGFSVQGKKFSFALKITNFFNKPSSEFTIFSVRIFSEQGQNLVEDFDQRSFFVGVLNPNESLTIDIADSGQFMYGLVRIETSCALKDTSLKIKFLQKNPFSEEISVTGENYWVDFCYMKSLSEHTQERSNNIMIKLTVVLLILTVLQIAKLFESELTEFTNLINLYFNNSDFVSKQLITALVAFFTTFIYLISFAEKKGNTNIFGSVSRKLRNFKIN